MTASTLTTKGQVTIPKSVREVLGVHAGDRVAFFVRQDGIVELRPETFDLKELFGILEYRGRAVSVKKMGTAIGEAAARSFGRSVKA
jgi:AbrB family looped-hinge helix DNA binding protein